MDARAAVRAAVFAFTHRGGDCRGGDCRLVRGAHPVSLIFGRVEFRCGVSPGCVRRDSADGLLSIHVYSSVKLLKEHSNQNATTVLFAVVEECEFQIARLKLGSVQ